MSNAITDYLNWIIKSEDTTLDEDLPGFASEASLRAKEILSSVTPYESESKDKPPVPERLSVWMHRRTKNLYTVLAVANTDADRPKEDRPVTVTYEDLLGRIWSRPLSDWPRSFVELYRPSTLPPGVLDEPESGMLPGKEQCLGEDGAFGMKRCKYERGHGGDHSFRREAKRRASVFLPPVSQFIHNFISLVNQDHDDHIVLGRETSAIQLRDEINGLIEERNSALKDAVLLIQKIHHLEATPNLSEEQDWKALAQHLLQALVGIRNNIGAASLVRNPAGKRLRDDADEAIEEAAAAGIFSEFVGL